MYANCHSFSQPTYIGTGTEGFIEFIKKIIHDGTNHQWQEWPCPPRLPSGNSDETYGRPIPLGKVACKSDDLLATRLFYIILLVSIAQNITKSIRYSHCPPPLLLSAAAPFPPPPYIFCCVIPPLPPKKTLFIDH